MEELKFHAFHSVNGHWKNVLYRVSRWKDRFLLQPVYNQNEQKVEDIPDNILFSSDFETDDPDHQGLLDSLKWKLEELKLEESLKK